MAGSAGSHHSAPGRAHDPIGQSLQACTTRSRPIRRATASRRPVVVRSGWPLDHPRPHTALVVWPYLTWRAYSAYDADLNGIPDSWYQFWRQRRVSLKGPLLRDGVEDDHKAALPFSRWLCQRPVRTQQITDVELGRLPLSTLRKYPAIVFPGHSEYYEPATYDLLKRYRDERRQPRLPAGQPVLPPGAARPGARTRS